MLEQLVDRTILLWWRLRGLRPVTTIRCPQCGETARIALYEAEEGAFYFRCPQHQGWIGSDRAHELQLS